MSAPSSKAEYEQAMEALLEAGLTEEEAKQQLDNYET